MGRPFKTKPAAKAKADADKIAKRKATRVRRLRARGVKPRVVAGTAAARALGIG